MSRAREKHKHLPKYVYLVHGAYWYRPPNGKNERLAAEGDESGMYRRYVEVMQPVPVVTREGATLNEYFDRYVRDILPEKAPRTQKDYVRHIAILRETFGHMLPNEVEPKHIGRFLDVRVGKVQRNRQVAVLSALYNVMLGSWFVADRNPCAKVKRNQTRPRTRYVTDEEFALVRAAMPTWHQIAMDLALLTGQRQGDLLALKWEDVGADGIYVQQGKTGKKIRIALSPALEEVLGRAKRMLPSLPRKYVLRQLKSGQGYTGEGFRSIWQRRMRKLVRAGKVEAFAFHDLRAKTVSDSATLEDAFERAGHQNMQITRRTYDRGIRLVKPLK